MSETKKKESFEPDRFPGTLEATGFRKTSSDFVWTIATPQKYEEYAKVMLSRLSCLGVFFFVPCTPEELDHLLRQKTDQVPQNELPGPGHDAVPTVTVDVMATELNMTERNVQLLEQKGLLVRATPGHYDTLASCGSLWKALKEQESGKNDDHNHERTEAMRLKRKERELDYYERAGKLVLAEAVGRAIEKAKAAEKQQVLFMPKQLAPLLEGDAAEREAILEEWGYKFLKGQTEINITADITAAPAPDPDRMPEMLKRKKRKKRKK